MRERCWPGYKPTPGRKAYAKGSCVKEANAAAIAAATAIAKKKSGNYDKEGMRKTPYKNPDHPSVKSNEQRRKDMKENFAGDSPQQVAGSAQATLTDRPNKEPMKKYKELKNITELSTDLLHRYKEKAAADATKADKEGDIARGNKRFSGVVKATNKQFANFKKKGFSEEVEQINELSKDTLRTYVSKAGSDKSKAIQKRNNVKYKKTHGDDWNKEVATNISNKETKKIKKRTVGLVRAVAKLNKEDTTNKTDNFKVIKPKESEHETYFKFVTGKAKMGKALSNKEKDFVRSYKLMKQEEVEQIDEISAQAHKDYQAAARKDIKANLKHIHGEYGDIAKNIVNRRMKGLTMSNATTKLKKEEVEQIDEKNVPTSPEKWAQAKAQAKAKFDVYPSAYANGWAAKKYKAMGGGWKSVSEAVKDKFDIGEYDQEGDMAKSDLRSIMANAKKLHDMIEDADNLPEWCQNKITLAEDYISTVANYLTAEMNEEVDLQEKSDDYEVKQSKTDLDVHHVHYKGKKIGYVYGNKKDMWGHEYHAMGTGDDGHSSKREAVSALKADHKHHISGAYMKEEVEQIDELSKSTLGSYVKKASTNARINSMISKDFDHKATTARKPSTRDAYYGLSSKHKQKSWKRSDNVAKAVDRLTKEAKEDLPFTPDKPKKQSVVAGKYGAGYSTARHLARTAMQKQVEKMKKAPIKEESRKAAIVKDIMKKKKGSEDAFQKDPEMSSTLTKL